MNDRPEQRLRLEDFIPYRLSITSNTVSSAIAELYSKRFDLSIPEWRVMAVVARFEGISAREVAEKTRMDKVAVSRAVRRLHDSGRLTRIQSSDDRRRSELSLSELGHEVYRGVAPLAMDYERRLLEALTEDERASLGDLLTRLRERAEKMETPP